MPGIYFQKGDVLMSTIRNKVMTQTSFFKADLNCGGYGMTTEVEIESLPTQHLFLMKHKVSGQSKQNSSGSCMTPPQARTKGAAVQAPDSGVSLGLKEGFVTVNFQGKCDYRIS